MTTDEEQDLLRAMLVMAAAGVDAMAKQVIHDALPIVSSSDDLARGQFEDYLARRFVSDVESAVAGRRPQFVAPLLAAPDAQRAATENYIDYLTSGSLQSADELRKIAAAFGLTRELLTTDFGGLKSIFDVRNKIIHELDINLSAERRNRNLRSKTDLVKATNTLLGAGEELLKAVNQQVARYGPKGSG